MSAGGSVPSAARAAASAAAAPDASAASVAVARTGTEAMLTRPMPTEPFDRGQGDTDDRPVLGPSIELLERPAARRSGNSDLDQEFVGGQSRLEEPLEEVRGRDLPATTRTLGHEGAAERQDHGWEGPRRRRRATAIHRWCPGCGPADHRRDVRLPPPTAAPRAASSSERSTSRCRVSAPMAIVSPSSRM